jgi:hypothetical protein
VPYPNLKHWTTSFETAALYILANRPDLPNLDAYQLRAEPCTKHGEMCVRVVYGALIDHYRWVLTDPASLADTLLRTMLPQTAEPKRVQQVAS